MRAQIYESAGMRFDGSPTSNGNTESNTGGDPTRAAWIKYSESGGNDGNNIEGYNSGNQGIDRKEGKGYTPFSGKGTVVGGS